MRRSSVARCEPGIVRANAGLDSARERQKKIEQGRDPAPNNANHALQRLRCDATLRLEYPCYRSRRPAALRRLSSQDLDRAVIDAKDCFALTAQFANYPIRGNLSPGRKASVTCDAHASGPLRRPISGAGHPQNWRNNMPESVGRPCVFAGVAASLGVPGATDSATRHAPVPLFPADPA